MCLKLWGKRHILYVARGLMGVFPAPRKGNAYFAQQKSVAKRRIKPQRGAIAARRSVSRRVLRQEGMPR